MPYHSGELEVQARAGVASPRIGVHETIPPVAAQFLAAQRVVIASTADGEGRVWASLLAGEPGFARAVPHPASGHPLPAAPGEGLSRPSLSPLPAAPGEGLSRPSLSPLPAAPGKGLSRPSLSPLPAAPGEGLGVRVHLTPAAGNEVFDGDAGLLAIEFATRRRMRVNGRLHHEGATLVVETREVYSNCPQYITPQPVAVPCLAPAEASAALTEEQRAFVRNANTFFIATRHPEAGADASHRGGLPGFVEVADDRIRWPDYRGNNMFNTLGNLAVDPRCGLLFTDFRRTLQVTGRASIIWEGTTRTVELRVESVLYHSACAAPS